MPDISFPIGSTLKKIRANKGYTQKQISDDTMARSTYTKFETGAISPTLSKYLAILDHMDMSHEEFIYISNEYQLGEKETVKALFKQLERHVDEQVVDEIIEKGEQLLQGRYDQLTLDMVNACRGYKVLLAERDLAKAQDFAQKVWERLEQVDKSYLSELHLLNSILYLFNSETAAFLTDQAIACLDQYAECEEVKTLKISFLLHLTNVLLLDKKYEQALSYVEQMEAACDNAKYPLMWATALIRKEVCLTKIDSSAQPGLIEKAVRVFESLEKPELVDLVQKDPETFWNMYTQ